MITPRDIETKIELIENKLPSIVMDSGIPTPNWKDTSNLEQKMRDYNVPGLSIAVINEFQIEWIKQYGIIDKITKKKVTKKTLFEAGSTSKVLTALVALSLVNQGLLSLDEPVNNYLKSWKIPENELTENNPVTLRHLLTHTSGMNRPDSMFGVKEGHNVDIIQVLNGDSPALNDPAAIEKKPGSEHQYSNIAFIAIEKLLQDTLGKSTSKIINDYIFKPVNMKNSFAEYPSSNRDMSIILPHDNEGNVRETGYVKGTFGCAGLISTPEDIAKLSIELMKTYQGESEKIVSKKMIDEMLTTQLQFEPTKFFGWTGQGLGIFLIKSVDDLYFIHPGTNSPGAVCMMIGNPIKGHGLVIMSNGIMGELLHLEILCAIAEVYNWSIYRVS